MRSISVSPAFVDEGGTLPAGFFDQIGRCPEIIGKRRANQVADLLDAGTDECVEHETDMSRTGMPALLARGTIRTDLRFQFIDRLAEKIREQVRSQLPGHAEGFNVS